MEKNQTVLTEKSRNQLLVLEQMMESGPISAIDVSAQTKLSAATVSRVFRELREKELIVFVGKAETEKGRKPDLYIFNKGFGFLVHFHIGSQAIHGYLSDLGGEVIEKAAVHYIKNDTPDGFFSAIKEVYGRLEASGRSPKGKILAAGFSVPGVVNESGDSIYMVPDVYQLNKVKFTEYAARILGVPVIANNVSWLAAMGEKTRVYPYASSLIYMHFSNKIGVGAGIIYKNELIKGGMHYAGEVGQTWFSQLDTFEEYLNGEGSLDNVASMHYLFQKVREIAAVGKAPELSEDKVPLTLATVEQMAMDGNKEVQSVLDESIRIWAGIVVNLNLIINPEFIVLGGSISAENKYVLKLLNNQFDTMNQFRPNVQLSASGEDAQLYGGIHELKEYVNRNIIYVKAISDNE